MKLPIKFDEVLLPREGIDMEKWCVVACDQFTSQPEYWEKLKEFAGDAPSALNLIYPECYLNDKPQERIAGIIDKMNDYLGKDIFRVVDDGLILVERTTSHGNKRYGLMMIVDLTQYSFDPKDKALIRATEGTVIERIPPRVKIRENCPLELPHILLLIDDEKRSVIEPLIGADNELLYDTDLNMNGGHIKGYHVKNRKGVENALNDLLKASTEKYGEPLLFAVGDGNHSLATAKACYKPENPRSQYALVEVENIYDEGILFEPIHRVVYPKNTADFVEKFNKAISGSVKSKMFVGKEERTINLPENSIEGVDKVQKFIDAYLKENGGELDYIHGENDLKGICAAKGGVGIVLKPMEKNTLFSYIVKNGVLPRKTFSMGEADEKRYYVESRKIK
ncbi:MAG: DUF1015 domain-containing protein [Clostridiales bacterium]|nr:DUF1015 domain-containing protein [Clostridiales bacterium]